MVALGGTYVLGYLHTGNWCVTRGRGWHWGRINRTAVQFYLLFLSLVIDKKSIFAPTSAFI